LKANAGSSHPSYRVPGRAVSLHAGRDLVRTACARRAAAQGRAAAAHLAAPGTPCVALAAGARRRRPAELAVDVRRGHRVRRPGCYGARADRNLVATGGSERRRYGRVDFQRRRSARRSTKLPRWNATSGAAAHGRGRLRAGVRRPAAARHARADLQAFARSSPNDARRVELIEGRRMPSPSKAFSGFSAAAHALANSDAGAVRRTARLTLCDGAIAGARAVELAIAACARQRRYTGAAAVDLTFSVRAVEIARTRSIACK